MFSCNNNPDQENNDNPKVNPDNGGDLYIYESPYFSPTTANLGDTVKMVIPLGNDGDIDYGTSYPIGLYNDTIESVQLQYDSSLDAWTGNLVITQYYPESISFNQISFKDNNNERYTFWPEDDYTANDLTITGTTPDTTAPVLNTNSVSFSTTTASINDTVSLYASFSDPETGIREYWSASIKLENTSTGWTSDYILLSYDATEDRYAGEFTITDDFPTEVTIQSLWAKNGVGITTRPQAGDDFTSPTLTIQ